MKDQIREVIFVRGELIEFSAIIYLENGTRPTAILHAKFRSDKVLLGHRSHPDMEQLSQLVHGVSEQIARFYGYELMVTPIWEVHDPGFHKNLLLEMKHQRDLRILTGQQLLCLN